jgi:diguanylate cyclase (GGDEF)-like protein
LDRLRGGTIRHYGPGDGLISLEGMAGAAMEDPRGHLWFGSTLGLMQYEPARDRPVPALPQVVVDGAFASNQGPIRPGARIPTPPGTITFRLAVPSFRDEDALRYRHRLIPVETEWSEPEYSNVVRLAGAAPGAYRFEAIAEDTSGSRSAKVMTFAFSVAPPWWRTPFAEILECLLLIGLVVLALRVRTRRLERERSRLERLVEERTQELKHQAAELRRLASTDELTGTANRREFAQALDRELQRLSRSPAGSRLSLILLDLDGFKEVNDTYGHDAGDRLLAAIGRRLRERLRSTDLVARFGGDVFAVVLPMTSRAGAQRAALKLIQAVAKVKVSVGDREIGVTASAGFAVVASTADMTGKLDHLITQADTALYGAKRAGGNRVFSMDGTWQ